MGQHYRIIGLQPFEGFLRRAYCSVDAERIARVPPALRQRAGKTPVPAVSLGLTEHQEFPISVVHAGEERR